MTPEDMEKSLGGLESKVKRMEDAQIVQGVLERRIEDRIESLTAAAEETRRGAEATARAAESLLQVVASHEHRLAGVEERLAGLEDSRASMEAAMRSLFERMDRFIRGLESNGHKQDNP